MNDTEVLRLAGGIETAWRYATLWREHWDTLAAHARVWTSLFGTVA